MCEIKVRSVRQILFSICRQQSMADKVLATLHTECEWMVGGQPWLLFISDCRDLSALEPNSAHYEE